MAGSLGRLPTRPKQPGASKGATTSVTRPRTRSSNPVPSSKESANFRTLNGGGPKVQKEETVGALAKRAWTSSWLQASAWLYCYWHEPGAI